MRMYKVTRINNKNNMRYFCKPLTIEKQKEARLLIKKHENNSIDAFNQKYLKNGETPPLYTTIIDSKNNRIVKIYPNGKTEYVYRHIIKYT